MLIEVPFYVFFNYCRKMIEIAMLSALGFGQYTVYPIYILRWSNVPSLFAYFSVDLYPYPITCTHSEASFCLLLLHDWRSLTNLIRHCRWFHSRKRIEIFSAEGVFKIKRLDDTPIFWAINSAPWCHLCHSSITQTQTQKMNEDYQSRAFQFPTTILSVF